MPRYAMRATIQRGLTLINQPPNAIIGAAYSWQPQAVGGTTPYSFECLNPGSLPAGWAFNNGTATLSNAGPSVAGTFDLVLYIHDAEYDYDRTVTVTVNTIALPLTLSGDIADGITGAAATGGFTAAGGTPPYTYSLASGPCAIDASIGAPTGNLFAAATYNWTATVVDAASVPATINGSTLVNYATLAYSSGALANIYDVGDAGSTAGAVTFTGGDGTLVAATIASGSLPPGCTASHSGMTWVLSGAATTYGSYTFVPRVQSGDGQFANGPSQTIIVGDTIYSLSVSRIHFDGTPGATAITDQKGLTWTLNTAGAPTTALSSTQKVFGATSGYFNNGGYSTPRTPFNFGTGAFSVKVRLWPADTGVDRDFFSHRNSADTANFWGMRRNSNNGIRVFAVLAGSLVCDVSTPNNVITGSAQNAVEIQRNATTGAIEIYVGGILQTLTGTNFANNTIAMPYTVYDVFIGQGDNTVPGGWLGYIDEFDVSIVRRHTGSSYTVETRAFQNGGV